MTAGEKKPQPVVRNTVIVLIRQGRDDRVIRFAETRDRRIETYPAAHPVDRLEAPGGDEPCPRISRHAVVRPALERGHERVVQRLLGEIEIAEETDERRQDLARVRAVDLVDPIGHQIAHGSPIMKPRSHVTPD